MSTVLNPHTAQTPQPVKISQVLDGYVQSSSYMDRDLRLLLTQMIELSKDPFYLNKNQRFKKITLIQKSLTPAMVIEFFLYRKCSQSFLTVLPAFINQNASLLPNFEKIITTYSPYRKMYPTDIFINRRLGIPTDFDNDSWRDSKWAFEPTKKLFIQEKKNDKQESIAFLNYIHAVLKLDIPFSNKQIQTALRLEDKALLNLVSTDRLKEVVCTIYQKDMSDRTIRGNCILNYYLTELNPTADAFLQLNFDTFAPQKLNNVFFSRNIHNKNQIALTNNLLEQIINKTLVLAQDKGNETIYRAYLKQLDNVVSKCAPLNVPFLIKKTLDQNNAEITDTLLTYNSFFPQKYLIRQYNAITNPSMKQVLEKHILKTEKSICKKQVKKFILKHSSLHPFFLSYVKTK